jgi:hypothetical protein
LSSRAIMATSPASAGQGDALRLGPTALIVKKV